MINNFTLSLSLSLSVCVLKDNLDVKIASGWC